MSSSAIMALIKEKEKELEKLTTIKGNATKLKSALDCVSQNYIAAGKALGEVGTIGNNKFDYGKTENLGNSYGEMTNTLEGSISTINGTISELESEIDTLYAAYEQALEEERRKEEARLQEELLQETKRNYRSKLKENA